MRNKGKSWSRKQLLVIELLATNPHLTHKTIAKKAGISDRTLRRWKRLPGFWDAVEERTKEYLKENLPKMLHALMKEAKKGKVKHGKLILEYLEKLRDRIEHSGEVQFVVVWDDSGSEEAH
jgi:hypothetical protein